MASAYDAANFMSKSELLGWINETMGLRLTKVEETANGAVACQLLDALHPGVVPIKKVDFNARGEYDMINNYKVLQDVFDKLKVAKHIEVAKLIKGKPLDNLEFMQFMRSYWDSQTMGQAISGYDGPSRRAGAKSGDMKGLSVAMGTAPASKTPSNRPAAVGVGSAAKARVGTVKANSPGDKHNASDQGSVHEWRSKAETLEKEKEFYYSKLREIELLCQTPTICDIPIMKQVEAILYAATPEEGRTLLISTQNEFAGRTYLEEDQLAAEAANGN